MTKCNGALFLYDGDSFSLYTVIILGSLVGLYLLIRMCRLCSSAFSYSNFHIHETYKFYALAMLALTFTTFYHKLQLDLILDVDTTPNIQSGFEILIELFGVIGIYFTRLLYTLNGCDYSNQNELTMSRIISSAYLGQKNPIKKKIQIIKRAIVYAIFPIFIALTGIGILKQQSGWCVIAEVCMVLSSIVTLITFSAGIGLFLYRRWDDPSIFLKTKATIIYLLVAIAFRQLYLLTTQIIQTPIFQEDYIVITFNLLCILIPLVALSVLSEHQLERQKCAILRSSEVMLFKTIVG